MNRMQVSRQVLIAAILLLAGVQSFAQNTAAINEIKAFQKTLNEEYANPLTSPLTDEDQVVFEALDFYPINLEYRITATLELTPNEPVFQMVTTTARRPEYVRFGILHFKINGVDLKLNVYRNIELTKKPEYADYLFVPFTDKTSGNTSYGGGRYIDLRVPKGNTVLLDFNQAYNPYCAYNHKYSCPIPPDENRLALAIPAGVKAFH